MKRIEETLQSNGAVTRQDLLALLKGKDEKISEGQIDVLFKLLDTDGKRWLMQILGSSRREKSWESSLHWDIIGM